jgi:hypothetical protein
VSSASFELSVFKIELASSIFFSILSFCFSVSRRRFFKEGGVVEDAKRMQAIFFH